MKKQIDIHESVTDVYWWNKYCQKRYVINQGGTYSGKTYSILQVLIDRAIEEEGVRILVTATDFPRLQGDCLNVFRKLISTDKISPFFVDTSLVEGPYRLINGSEFIFRTFDSREKAKGPKRDYMYVNEASGYDYEIFKELDTRVEKQVFMDYNPSQRFWCHDKFHYHPQSQVFVSTFARNPFCPDDIKKKLLGWKKIYDETGSEEALNEWRVYGQGKTGIVSGIIIPNWRMITTFPDPYYLRTNSAGVSSVYGLDFGYTSDPTAIGKIGIRAENNRIVADELMYETGFNSYDLADKFEELGIRKNKDIIVADSANLPAIDHLARQGYRMVAAKKDPGSVKAGLEAIRKNGLDVTQRSENFHEELKRYVYKKQNGVYNKDMPIDAWNHGVDLLRYSLMYFLHGWGELRTSVIKKPTGKRRAYAH